MEKTIYRSKSRSFSKKQNEIILNFFVLDEVIQIKKSVFEAPLCISNEKLMQVLNNAIKFLTHFHPEIMSDLPGKTDEKLLFEKIRHRSITVHEGINELYEVLDVLRKEYGPETYGLLDIDYKNNIDDIRIFLEKIGVNIKKISPDLSELEKRSSHGLEEIEKNKGKKRGNKSKSAISDLIEYLVKIYELATQKNIQENVKYGTHRDRELKGEFYLFVKMVFEAINKKYKTIYFNKYNPFNILISDNSLALSKHVERVLQHTTSKQTDTERLL